MKKQIFTLCLTVLFISPFSALSKEVVVSVPGMVCQMCVHGMRKAFKDAVKNANQDVHVDLASKRLRLNLSAQLSDDEIKQRVRNAGYKAQAITR